MWGGGAPRATGPTQAFGLGRELVGGVGGDALRVSRKRDDPLRASWHILVPSAEVVREARQTTNGIWDVVQVRIFKVLAEVWKGAGLRVWVDWGRSRIFAQLISCSEKTIELKHFPTLCRDHFDV